MYQFDTFEFLIVLVVWKCLVTLRLLGMLRHLRNSRLLLLDKNLSTPNVRLGVLFFYVNI